MYDKTFFKKLVLLILILALLLAGCEYPNPAQQPLAPTMSLPTETEVPLELELPTAIVEIPTMTSIPAVETFFTPTDTPTAEPAESTNLCGTTGSLSILMIGMDVLGSSKPNGADAIRLLKVDFDTQTIKVVSIPRDMIIQTASSNQATDLASKLGMVYYDGFTAAAGTPLEKNAVGAGALSQVLFSNFGVGADHYITLQMDQFANMVDTVGGVEVNVAATVTTEHNVTFQAGAQTLNGSQAMEYVRYINPGGETERIARQNAVMDSLQSKLVTSETLAQLPTLIGQFKDSLVTDLSLEQITQVSCLALSMPRENISFGSLSTPDLVKENVPDAGKISEYLQQFLGD